MTKDALPSSPSRESAAPIDAVDAESHRLDSINSVVQKKKDRKKARRALADLLEVSEDEVRGLEKRLKKVESLPERGIETLFRTTSKNHYMLKRLVDSKAGILLSINAIIISIVLGTLLPDLSQDQHLLVPTIMLLATNLLSIAFAVLAARPSPLAANAAGDPNTHASEIYFALFYKLDRGEFRSRFRGLMEDRDELYDAMIDDIYSLGHDLARKFKYLGSAYRVFAFGLSLSVITFVLCHILFAPNS